MATTEGAVTTTAKPAKKAAARKAPAKKAAAPKVTARKAAAKKAPAKTAGKKIRWAVAQVFPNGKNQAGTGHGGTQYKIVRASNGEFIAGFVNTAGKTIELVRGSFSAAYWATVNHNKTAVDKAGKKATPAAAKSVA